MYLIIFTAKNRCNEVKICPKQKYKKANRTVFAENKKTSTRLYVAQAFKPVSDKRETPFQRKKTAQNKEPTKDRKMLA